MDEINVKEERIRSMAMIYYSRQEVRKNMVEFGKNRECVPRYFEGFGKRPDAFNYESDILELVKKGATSFHCSEELWKEPLDLSIDMKPEQLDNLRRGWDLLIDVDAKYFDYAKIYAEILIDVLKEKGINNIGIKFSGSKGFHLIIPWKAFPEQISDKKAKDMFPEWPRLICRYLSQKVSERLKERILELGIQNSKGQTENYCRKCGAIAVRKKIFFIGCTSCRTEIQIPEELFDKKRKFYCLNCFKDLSFLKNKNFNIDSLKSEEIYKCSSCGLDSKINPKNFGERIKTQTIDADIVLVSSRHLFRMPYSLHEKTSLASVVIDCSRIKEFDLKDAHPLKVTSVKNFIPDSEPGEASELLREAIESAPINAEYENKNFSNENKPNKFQEIIIKDITPEFYPPVIKQILQGMKSDGRKRALFILFNFFRSLKLEDEKIQEIIEEWNKKNYEPLNPSYLKSQLVWHFRTPPKLPPNYNKPFYKEIGIYPTQEEFRSKNPVNYVVRIKFARKNSRKIGKQKHF